MITDEKGRIIAQKVMESSHTAHPCDCDCGKNIEDVTEQAFQFAKSQTIQPSPFDPSGHVMFANMVEFKIKELLKA